MTAPRQNQLSPSPALYLRPLEGLALSVLAALIVWAVVQAVHPVFHVPKEFNVPSIGRPTAEFVAYAREQSRCDRWHAEVYLASLGFLVAAALAIREALARRSWLPAVFAPVLGAAGGILGGYFGCRVLESMPSDGGAELMSDLKAQLAVTLPLGLGIGLALALGAASNSATAALKIAFTGLLAGALAGVIYPIALSILLPSTSTDTLLPAESTSRLLWFFLLAATPGLLIPLAKNKIQNLNSKI